MHTTNTSVEKHFFTLYQQFCFLSSLLAVFRWRTFCRWIREWAFFSSQHTSHLGSHVRNRHHPTVAAVRQPWITFACTVSVAVCKGFSSYFESFFPKASSGWTDRYAWYFQLFIRWNLCRTSSPHPQPAPPAGFEVISWLCNTLALYCTSWTFFHFMNIQQSIWKFLLQKRN